MAGLIMNQTIAPESAGAGFASPKIRKDRDSSFLAHGQRNQTPYFLHLVCQWSADGLLFHSLTAPVEQLPAGLPARTELFSSANQRAKGTILFVLLSRGRSRDAQRLGNASRDRKNETGAGVAQARPVIRPVFPRLRDCSAFSFILQ